MAGQCSNEGTSTGNISAEYSNSTVHLNVKTLDSHIYSFQVDKNMPVLLLKEKIANEIGLPVDVENGDTLHLVDRQPNQSQAQRSGTISSETSGTNGNQEGNYVGSGAPRNRVGPISHSVVVGTLNMGDQGEGIVPGLTRVIGAVLNSIRIGGQSLPNASQPSSSAPPRNETGGMQAGNQNQAGNQAQSGQTTTGQPIPNSLITLSEFINRMKETLSQNGYQPNLTLTNSRDQPRVELPYNAQQLKGYQHLKR